jgi:hypothetical protein
LDEEVTGFTGCSVKCMSGVVAGCVLLAVLLLCLLLLHLYQHCHEAPPEALDDLDLLYFYFHLWADQGDADAAEDEEGNQGAAGVMGMLRQLRQGGEEDETQARGKSGGSGAMLSSSNMLSQSAFSATSVSCSGYGSQYEVSLPTGISPSTSPSSVIVSE